jgi:antibiotic biosynthesis monooxygenase (ABM) superfamily enzyme
MVKNEPITAIVSRSVKPQKIVEFESLISEMAKRASQFEGALGSTLFKSSSSIDPEYRVMFKFQNLNSLKIWEASSQRTEILEKLEDLLMSTGEREQVSGLITWFTLPSANPLTPPPRYKIAFVSWLALYPAVTFLFWVLGPWLADFPLLIRALMVTALVIVLMTYLLMPFMTKWFSFWLYPKSKHKDSD